MRTPSRWSIAVRRADGGIHVESHDAGGSMPSVPFLRGPVVLVESLRVALDAIRVSVRVTTGVESRRNEVGSTLAAVAFTFIVLFGAGPGVAVGASGLRGAAADVAEGAIRVAMFVLYLAAVGRSRTAVELFRYHGAEHKVIAAFERSGTLPALEDARPVSPIHNRCGTNFAMLLLIVAGFTYAPVPRTPLWAGALLRMALVPVAAALAYELMRVAAREHDQLWSRFVTWPGRAAQRITTREPGDAQLEVARAALESLLG
jgi:uncharacterized protein YqhQ